METTGIVLLAHGKRGYGYMAFNLALSIKHHGCNLPIYLFANEGTLSGVPLLFFDHVEYISEDFYKDGPILNVAKSKINILKHLPFDHNLYLDVDGMALKDLTPFVESVINAGKPYMTDVMGTGLYGDNIPYDAWAKHEYAWPFFELDKTDTWRTIQSSWAYFKRGSFIDSMYNTLAHYLYKGYDLKELKGRWAKNQLPDELLFSGVCAKWNYDPSFTESPIFFGNTYSKTPQQVAEDHYILSMYGNGDRPNSLTKPMWQEYYSQEMYKIATSHKMPWYKKEYIMRDKILNS